MENEIGHMRKELPLHVLEEESPSDRGEEFKAAQKLETETALYPFL